ncbi:hypothetical protein ACIRU8_44135 [Streptomyces sp. NPDC101175]|uniref:hypothetical protein n=1 Tax=Streptomyces sp. NPDC101175 TaxID=3366123 RepID=UPI0038378F4A
MVVSYDLHQRLTEADSGIDPVGQVALASAWGELDDHRVSGRPEIMDGTHCQIERRSAVRAIAGRERHGRRRSRAEGVPPDADVARQYAAITAAVPALAGEGHTAVFQLKTSLW